MYNYLKGRICRGLNNEDDARAYLIVEISLKVVVTSSTESNQH
jgi:hypothetical protein